MRNASLLAIASQCPVNGGPAVYLAQSLIRQYNDTISFDDDYACSPANLRMNGDEEEKIYYFNQEPNVIDIKNSEVRLSPNPSSNILNIDYSSLEFDNNREIILKIYNNIGQQVGYLKTGNLNGTVQYDVSNLANGNYIVLLSLPEKSYHLKFNVIH